MKLAHWPNRYAKRPARPVLRSTQEIAELLGVSQQVFVAMVNSHGGAPKRSTPSGPTRCGTGASRRY